MMNNITNVEKDSKQQRERNATTFKYIFLNKIAFI